MTSTATKYVVAILLPSALAGQVSNDYGATFHSFTTAVNRQMMGTGAHKFERGQTIKGNVTMMDPIAAFLIKKTPIVAYDRVGGPACHPKTWWPFSVSHIEALNSIAVIYPTFYVHCTEVRLGFLADNSGYYEIGDLGFIALLWWAPVPGTFTSGKFDGLNDRWFPSLKIPFFHTSDLHSPTTDPVGFFPILFAGENPITQGSGNGIMENMILILDDLGRVRISFLCDDADGYGVFLAVLFLLIAFAAAFVLVRMFQLGKFFTVQGTGVLLEGATACTIRFVEYIFGWCERTLYTFRWQIEDFEKCVSMASTILIAFSYVPIIVRLSPMARRVLYALASAVALALPIAYYVVIFPYSCMFCVEEKGFEVVLTAKNTAETLQNKLDGAIVYLAGLYTAMVLFILTSGAAVAKIIVVAKQADSAKLVQAGKRLVAFALPQVIALIIIVIAEDKAQYTAGKPDDAGGAWEPDYLKDDFVIWVWYVRPWAILTIAFTQVYGTYVLTCKTEHASPGSSSS